MQQMQRKQLQAKLENIFTSSRVPGTYARNPEPSRAGVLSGALSSGLEALGFGGQSAYKGAEFMTGLTPASALDQLDRGEPGAALQSFVGGPELAMATGPAKRGLTLNSGPKLMEMYHGTTASDLFDVPTGGRSDVGLHLTRDPNTADQYAGIDNQMNNGPEGAVGGRVYPVLVDPGRTFKGRGKIGDPIDWNDTTAVINAIEDSAGPYGVHPSVKGVLADLQSGKRIDDIFKSRGYDSLEYDHYPLPHMEPSHAMMVFNDAGRVIPKFSDEGLAAIKEGRVKKAKKRTTWDDADLTDYWGGWAKEN